MKLGYSLGFLIVVLGRQQLFTENTLTVVLPVLLHKSGKVLTRVARLWGIVLSVNLLGTCMFAYFVAYTSIFDQQTKAAFYAIGYTHVGIAFGTTFLRAIFAGWLIALMVWLLPGAEHARVIIIIILTYIIGLGGFAHIIAGSTTVFYLVAIKAVSRGDYTLHFFFPALFGNVAGGISLVAALGHAQVVGGKTNSSQN
jgi:formate-nitrite transporter family protein